MNSINYKELIAQAFSLNWKNKFLWFFGFFLFLSSVVTNVNTYNGNFLEKLNLLPSLTAFTQVHPNIFIGMIILFLFTIIALFALRIMSTVAITKSVNNINLYRQISIKNIFLETKTSFWRLFWLELLLSLVLAFIIGTLSFPISYLFFLDAKIFAFFLLAFAIVIFIPLILLAFYLRKYAYFFIILGDFKLKVSIESAYLLTIKNMRESLRMGIANILLEFLFLFILLTICIANVIIFTPLALVSYLLFASIGATTVLVVGIIALTIELIVLFSWYNSFLQTAWFLFFQRLSFKKDTKEKLDVKEKIKESVPSPETS